MPVETRRSKNNFWIRLIIIVVITGIVIGAAGAYFYYLPQSRTINTSADMTLSARQLYSSYIHNADSAAKAYQDKVILISGRIAAIEPDKGGNTNISFELGPEVMANVMAEFAPESHKDVKDLKNGDSIRFKGLVHKQEDLMGIPGDIIIKNATLVK